MDLPRPYHLHWGPLVSEVWHGVVFWYLKLVEVVGILWIISAGALAAGHRFWDGEEEIEVPMRFDEDPMDERQRELWKPIHVHVPNERIPLLDHLRWEHWVNGVMLMADLRTVPMNQLADWLTTRHEALHAEAGTTSRTAEES